MKNKSALSPVIATILLILISITAIAIIAGVVVPFVKDQMGKTKCLETARQVTINKEYGYACYYVDSINPSIRNVKITISRGDVQIDGIKIKIGSETGSKVFEIKEGGPNTDVTLLGGGIFKFPGIGEDVTYILDVDTITESGSATYAEIYPVIEGGMCDRTDDTRLEGCSVI